MHVLISLDAQNLEIRLRNWVDCLVRVDGMQPQNDVVILGVYVTVVVLGGWGAMRFVRSGTYW